MEERPCSWSRESKWVKWGRVSLESCFLQHLLVLTSHLHLLVPAIKTRGQLSSTQTHCLSFSHTNFLSSHALAPNMNSSLTQEKKLLNHSMQLSNAAACAAVCCSDLFAACHTAASGLFAAACLHANHDIVKANHSSPSGVAHRCSTCRSISPLLGCTFVAQVRIATDGCEILAQV